MKIISWNVNGIRAVMKKWFLEFFEEEKPDIFAIQETKAFQEQLPVELVTFLNINWYSIQRHNGTRPWYAGTAIFYKNELWTKWKNSEKKEDNIWLDCFVPRNDELETWTQSDTFFEDNEILNQDGRITTLDLWDTELLNIYFPNGGTRADGTEMLSYKLSFYDELIKYCDRVVEGWKDIIVCGDLNICHTEIDIARPEANQKSIWFLPIEREKVSEFFSHWYIDTFRNFFPKLSNQYTRWSYRAGARERNVGRRLDYFVVNEKIISKVKKIKHLTDVMWSDHCPVVMEFEV